MSSIAITGGATGTGVFSLVAPSTSTNRTINLPDSNGTILTTATAGVPVNGPAFSVYRAGNQLISANTLTKIQLNTENFDTASAYDNTTNYRFTPLVAGYYQFSFGVMISSVDPTAYVYSQIRKNNGDYSRGSSTFAASSNYPSSTGSCLVYLNGSTDYVELSVYTNTTVGVYDANFGTFMTGFLARAA